MAIRPFQSLYVHVPFCHGKCGYCDFYSLGQFTDDEVNAYLLRLAEEFAEMAEFCTPLRSVFIGGGTPSALSPAQLERLLKLIRIHFPLEENCEWTMECNPESMDATKASLAISMGVNRISIGIQSFGSTIRATLMRRGSLDNLPALIEKMRRAGLKNLNMDLIYAIPGETCEDWLEDMRIAASLAPEHISAYSLILVNNTPLGKLFHESVDDAVFLKFWKSTRKTLPLYGFSQYEISNFCKKGRECRHNLDVWHGGTYLGCGPAAVSFNGEDRPANPPSLKKWLEHAEQEHDRLGERERAAEILAFGMRTVKGWNLQEFQKLTGFTPQELRSKALDRLQALNLLSINDQRIRPTAKGLLFNNDILEQLI